MDVPQDELPLLYTWIDGIPLSRPKRNISRDFSDAVLAAEVVAHYCPRLVDVHNYSAANGLAQKIYNWSTLNNKVFRRLHFTLTKEDIEAVASCEPQMIERILKLLKYKIAKYRPNGLNGDSDPVKEPSDGGHCHEFHDHRSTRHPNPQRELFPRFGQTQQSQVKDVVSQGQEYLPEPECTKRNMRGSQEQYSTSRTSSPHRGCNSQELGLMNAKLEEKNIYIRELGETIEVNNPDHIKRSSCGLSNIPPVLLPFTTKFFLYLTCSFWRRK
ncbi:uncharacterized protein [Physcomitrium patens]|uniref:uncharacterized protein isoform X2 n=1 Tax=Physcomitrium patens TaxID=3218 RepID=UPI000D156D8A|nr:sperm flagellar protein 1-like isoform X2 [Physcomitrium patens]|eukprot:XP_024379980.1 sperm flagellar protein 1-like isoform X2 [Physcomitrella patens]